MQETTKPPVPAVPAEDPSEKRSERNAWSDEQEKGSYYYDDAHGYETFTPEEDEPSADTSTSAGGETTPS